MPEFSTGIADMKESIALLPIAVFYLALRSTVFAGIPVPDVTLLMIFFMASRGASLDGALLAFVLGYVEDAFTGGVIGSSSFALVTVYVAVHLAAKKAHFTTPGIRAAGSAFFSLVKSALALMVLRAAGVEAQFHWAVAASAVVTAVFAPVAMNLLTRLSFFLNPHRFKNETT